jgi:hypothetical protein
VTPTGAPPPGPRVRVTGPPRRRAVVGRTADIDAGTRLGGVYMRSLLRDQLRLAVGVLTVMGLTIGLLPLLFYVAPELADVPVLGLPLGWLLPGVAVYPALVGLGWAYVRRAERNERDFAEIVSEKQE